MKVLKVILWVCGISFLISFIALILPWGIIENLYRLFGEQPIPASPTANYSFRVACFIVGLIGIYFIILALDPATYRRLIGFSAIALIACGVASVIIGLNAGIAPQFYIGDGLFGIVLGALMAIFNRKNLAA